MWKKRKSKDTAQPAAAGARRSPNSARQVQPHSAVVRCAVLCCAAAGSIQASAYLVGPFLDGSMSLRAASITR